MGTFPPASDGVNIGFYSPLGGYRYRRQPTFHMTCAISRAVFTVSATLSRSPESAGLGKDNPSSSSILSLGLTNQAPPRGGPWDGSGIFQLKLKLLWLLLFSSSSSSSSSSLRRKLSLGSGVREDGGVEDSEGGPDEMEGVAETSGARADEKIGLLELMLGEMLEEMLEERFAASDRKLY